MVRIKILTTPKVTTTVYDAPDDFEELAGSNDPSDLLGSSNDDLTIAWEAPTTFKTPR